MSHNIFITIINNNCNCNILHGLFIHKHAKIDTVLCHVHVSTIHTTSNMA